MSHPEHQAEEASDVEESGDEEYEEESEEGLKGAGVDIVRNLRFKPDIIAVRVIRAFRSVKVRQNKWRPVHHNLTADNIEFHACISKGGFGLVFSVENKDTRTEGKDGIKYAIKVMNLRLDTEEFNFDFDMGSDLSPDLTKTSEASVKDMEEVIRQSLRAKRANELRTSLEYIRSGHPSVCSLEGWAEFDILASNYYMYILELCDLGTLYSLVYAYHDEFEYIPEGFIWHAFEQLMSGLAFLHGEHPDYRDKREFRGRNRSTILRDLKPGNIFVQSPPPNSPENTYPTLKLADFGEAIHLPIGGTRDFYFGNGVCEPPDNKMSAKYDVWSVGAAIYFMAKLTQFPNVGIPRSESWGDLSKSERKAMTILRSNPQRFEMIDDHLTFDLYREIRWAMLMDRHNRPTALQVWRSVSSKNEQRKKLMYRKLGDFVQMGVDQALGKLEVVRTEFKVQQAEEEGFLWTYGGGAPVMRKQADRDIVLKSLEKEKKNTEAMKIAKLLKLKRESGENERLREARKRRRLVESKEIAKIEEERKQWGGFLKDNLKRRRLDKLKKRRGYGVGEA
ncbi:hypothetical protein NHQ30_003045 [Ciborinia camelliae]|nr:hypothetical protein NHQ30_003045 [Ciborinia camelliae]